MDPDAEAAPRPFRFEQGTDMLATFLSLMPDAAIAVNGSGTIVAVNSRIETFFGYQPHELEGKAIETLVPERLRHSHRNQRATYAKGPRARPMGAGLDLYARRKDGTEFPVDISLAPIGGEDHSLVVAAVRDISERKASQSAQTQLAAIVESSADGILSMTRDCVVTSWNPAAERMFGYQRGDVVGHHLSQFFPEDPSLEELMDAARSGHPSYPRDTRWLTSESKELDVAISVSALDVAAQAGYSVVVRDITVRKESEGQLRRQARRQMAAAEIRLNLLSDAPLETSLDLICKWAADLSEGNAAALIVGDEDRARVVGRFGDDEVLGVMREALGDLGDIDRPETISLDGDVEARAFPIAFPSAAISFPSDAIAWAALVIARHHDWPTSLQLDDIVDSLASQAVLAFELSAVRAERDQLLISADRERIARDLHDLVIQRLFGAGLRLQGALGMISNTAAASRVASTIDDLDTTIREIREAIFALEAAPGTGLRAKVLETVADATEQLGFKPAVWFHGPADRSIALPVQLEAVAVLREALSNSARHAHASRVEVHVSVDEDLSVLVADNGIGVGQPGRMSGIANSRARAELLSGSLDISPAEGGGTVFDWRVPLPPATSDS
jgi:PAS domain S-box-containing protein